MKPDLGPHYRSALQALNALLEHKPDKVHDEIESATEELVHVRDSLIAAVRRGHSGQREALREVNALLSLIVSAEFPLVGVRWKRIESARDEFARLAQLHTDEEAPAPGIR